LPEASIILAEFERKFASVGQLYKNFLTSSLLNIHSAVAKLFDVYKQFTKTDTQSKAMYIFCDFSLWRHQNCHCSNFPLRMVNLSIQDASVETHTISFLCLNNKPPIQALYIWKLNSIVHCSMDME